MPALSDKRRAAREPFIPKTDPEFEPWLRRVLNTKGMTLQALCDAAMMDDMTLRRIMRVPAYDYTISAVIRLANALDLEIGYLLHKLGIDIGASGLDAVRLQKAEALSEAMGTIVPAVRAGLSEAMNALDKDPGLPPLGEHETDRLIASIGKALALLDAAETRLLATGLHTFQHVTTEAEVAESRRPWSEPDDEYLRTHRDVDPKTLAASLSRSEKAVAFRLYQMRMDEQQRKDGE